MHPEHNKMDIYLIKQIKYYNLSAWNMCVHCTILSTFLLCETYNQIWELGEKNKRHIQVFLWGCFFPSPTCSLIFFPLDPYNTWTHQLNNLGHTASLYIDLEPTLNLIPSLHNFNWLIRCGSHKSGKKKVKNCNWMLTDTSTETTTIKYGTYYILTLYLYLGYFT